MKKSVSILVVDDEQVMRDVVFKILSREGYQVQTVADGASALEYINANHVDIIISDMMMPGLDGLELLRKINKQWPDISVIFMTGYGDTYSVKDALLQGADEYITKPFRSYEVSLVVQRAYYKLLSGRQKLTTKAQ